MPGQSNENDANNGKRCKHKILVTLLVVFIGLAAGVIGGLVAKAVKGKPDGTDNYEPTTAGEIELSFLLQICSYILWH